jgi:hypothetical protein
MDCRPVYSPAPPCGARSLFPTSADALDGLEGGYGSFYCCVAEACGARGSVVLLVH